MILRNYISWKLSLSSTTGTSIVNKYIDMNGTERSGCYRSTARDSLRTSLLLCVGDSDTPETGEEYNLISNTSSNFTQLLCTSSVTINQDSSNRWYYAQSMSLTGTNNSGSTQIIKEIGIYKNMQYQSGSNYCDVLFVRKVLDTPIEVADGASFEIPFQWIEY